MGFHIKESDLCFGFLLTCSLRFDRARVLVNYSPLIASLTDFPRHSCYSLPLIYRRLDGIAEYPIVSHRAEALVLPTTLIVHLVIQDWWCGTIQG